MAKTEFFNTNRKIFAGIVVGGIVAYVIYRNFSGTKTSGFTGRPYNPFTGSTPISFKNADGGCGNCQGCKGCGSSMANANGPVDNTAMCKEIMKELMSVRNSLKHSYNLPPSEITKLKNREMQLLAELQKYKCA